MGRAVLLQIAPRIAQGNPMRLQKAMHVHPGFIAEQAAYLRFAQLPFLISLYPHNHAARAPLFPEERIQFVDTGIPG